MGGALFLLALGRITHLFVTLRKFRKLLMLYLRLFLFIFLYLILIVFIFAFTIQYTSNETSIENMYSQYYTCLIEAGDTCSLDSSLTNYNLIMLKGFAISSLGLLLFLLFISWDVSRFWFLLARSLVFAVIRRSPEEVFSVARMVIYKSHSTVQTSLHSGDSLKISIDATVAEPDEKDDEGKETVTTREEDEQDVQSSSSSE